MTLSPTNADLTDTRSDARSGTATGLTYVNSPTDIRPVADYARRIDAIDQGLRSLVVKQLEGRYPRTLATIRFDKAGEIKVSVADGGDPAPYEPTEGERAAIRDAWKPDRFPEMLLAATIRNPPPMVKEALPDDLFEFRDDDGKIIMLQVRVQRHSERSYIPWTYWTDEKWRPIEPDGLLPLYGAGKDYLGKNDQLATATTAYIHEGAKAARVMRRMVEAQTPDAKKALSEHPWGAELQHAAHLGWIGGALAPDRTDWSVLAKAGIKNVRIVADHDAQGERAVAKISRLLSRYDITVERISFAGSYNGMSFPGSFDLGDPFPDNMFRKESDAQQQKEGDAQRQYIGPSMRACLDPATYATRPGPPPPKTGKREAPKGATPLLNTPFLSQWYLVIFEGQFAFIPAHDRSRMYLEPSFNVTTQQYSDVVRTSDLLRAHPDAMRCHGVAYEPGTPAAIVNVNGKRCVNTYVGSRIPRLTGDLRQWDQWRKEWRLWEEYLQHLFPEPKDCHEVMRWIATLISRPDIRMKYALLLASKMQGVGKTTLFEILRVIVGEHNCSAPTASDMFNSDFNDWLANKRLIVVNEVYEGGSRHAYNKLKSFVTDTSIEVNRKHLPRYTVNNCSHYIFCSNSLAALNIDGDDRRILAPTVTEKKWEMVDPATGQTLSSQQTWARFYNWLNSGGHQLIMLWADDFLRRAKPVGPGEDAPETSRKEQMIENSRSSEERLVLGLAVAAKQRAAEGCPVALVDGDIVSWLLHRASQAEHRRSIPTRPDTVCDWLVAGGLHVSERLTIGGHKQRVLLTEPVDGRLWRKLSPYRISPDDLIRSQDDAM